MMHKENYSECPFCAHVGDCNTCCECQNPEVEDDAVYGVDWV